MSGNQYRYRKARGGSCSIALIFFGQLWRKEGDETEVTPTHSLEESENELAQSKCLFERAPTEIYHAVARHLIS